MYLSSIDLFGFKSFAQRTRIKFDQGVTAIVGPNGCGKSNLVDAVRWVLGEQRESALRSDRMDNVIFGGSSKRRPLGMAEISLTLHDAGGDLPLEYEEVTVTRRLFRSGKSEYLLNKNVCRLKDLVDLFMDTGVSPDSYSIIELSMVEGIISEDPDEMRRLLDEATGVTRYKVRRREAFRRLVDACQDRERALDILAEVERQTNSLKRQVAKVRAYKRLQERANRVRSAIVLGEVRQLEARLEPLEESLGSLQEETERTSGELSACEAEVMRLEDDSLQLENDRQNYTRQFNAAQSDFQSVSGARARTEEDIRLNKWRLEKNREEAQRSTADLNDVEEQVQIAQSTLEKSQARLPALEARLKDRQMAFHQADGKFRETRAKSIESGGNLNNLRAKEAEVIRSSEARKASVKSRKDRLEELNRRRGELQSVLDRGREDLACAEADLGDRAQRLDDVRSRRADIHEKEETLREQMRSLEHEMDQSRALRDRIALQIEHFKELHRRSSPLYSAGGILASKYPDILSATLSDELQVEEKYVKAIECALQGMAYSRVVQQRESFETLLRCLQDESAGRAALLFGEAPAVDFSSTRAFARETGGLALADVIDGSSRASNWIRHFVRNIVLFESIQDIMRLAPLAAKRAILLVTSAGEFTDGQGLWIVGVSGDDSHQSVGVSARLKELARRLQEAEDHIRKIQGDIAVLQEETASLESDFLEAEESQRDAEQAFDLAKVKKLKLEAQIVSTDLLLEQLAREFTELPAEIEQLSLNENAQEEEYNEHLKRLAALEAELQSQQEDEARALEEREVFRQALAEVQIEVERARAEIGRAQDRFAELGQRCQRLSERIAALAQEEQSIISTLTRLDGELDAQRENVTEAGALVEDFRNKLEDADSKRHDLQEAQRAAGARVRESRSRLEEASRKIHQLQLDKVQIEIALSEERLKLERVNLDEISKEPSDPELLADLERKIRSSEPLNLAAENEYIEQKKRMDFLNEQLKDLDEAEKSLQRTVVTLNKEARQRFEAGFGRIRDNFKNVYREIFEGGNADIRLDQEDALESRIEILATPGNKRIGSLSLLSGGEKALTAIALLFAIYMEKPSPFCILDEVDAPLDDENTLRFCRLLEKFTPETQFLVVTHNKQTMEVARNLLGVTMEEEGISKVVPVQFS